jgi:[protein-PII] uridylyltransferase
LAFSARGELSAGREGVLSRFTLSAYPGTMASPYSSAQSNSSVSGQLRGAIEAAREALRGGLLRGDGGSALVTEFSLSVRHLLEEVLGPAPASAGRDCCILAIGGLARGRQGPYSDLDLVVLSSDGAAEGDDEFEAWMRSWVHPVWDAGLKANVTVQQSRSWLEGAATDLSLCSSLLDLHCLAGDESLLVPLQKEAQRRFFGDARVAFLGRLREESRARHARYGSTPYRVEPDLKYGAGGLRDLAVAEWALPEI